MPYETILINWFCKISLGKEKQHTKFIMVINMMGERETGLKFEV